jgi:hypothetical protein
MKGYLRAFKECLSNPIAVIANGDQWIMFVIFEIVTLAFAILFYKKYGSFIGFRKLFLIITAGIIIGYVIHFIVMVIFVGSLYNGN